MEFIGLFVTICGAASIARWLMEWFGKMEG
jgi:hypothetical protein